METNDGMGDIVTFINNEFGYAPQAAGDLNPYGYTVCGEFYIDLIEI